MNDQRWLGLDLDGSLAPTWCSAPVPSFPPSSKTFTTAQVLPSTGNSSALHLDPVVARCQSSYAASDYQVNFTSNSAGTITRESDGKSINFSYTQATGAFMFQAATDPVAGSLPAFDGLSVCRPRQALRWWPSDQFRIKPLQHRCQRCTTDFLRHPRALAIASPVAEPEHAGQQRR